MFYDDVDWIKLAQNVLHYRDLVNTVKTLECHKWSVISWPALQLIASQ
jgi:hypothetical protein